MGFPEVASGGIAFAREDVDILQRLDSVTAAGTSDDD